DDPQTTARRLEVIRSKPFLSSLYAEWYGMIAANFTPGQKVLEIGAGAGFLKELMPGLITSELFEVPGVDLVIDAQAMNLETATLDGIVMTDVFHHLPDSPRFFAEATRVIKPGGLIVMIEPWNTGWGRLIYQNLHHEPFQPEVMEWKFPPGGPLSTANGALPWIVMERDREEFTQRFPSLKIERITPLMPVSYLISGGVSMRSLVPGWSYPIVRHLEKLFVESQTGMFALIIINRV
ncbi:MAG: class I SAM-dependent methyltransferase, partial [Acidobacteriota bacterium]